MKTFLVLGGVLIFAGCPGSDTSPDDAVESADGDHSHDHDHDHDHGDDEPHPETYAEAVEQLVSIDKTIRDAFAADDADTAHGPLHDIGHLLEEVAALAAKEPMSEEQRADVQQAVDSLFDLYGAVDDTMHGREGKSYDEVSTEIDAALKTLQSATTASTADEGAIDESSE